jgi:hypothetical protein
MLDARMVTVLAAETNALNTKPAAGAAGKAMMTSSPTAAPVTVMVKFACSAAAISPKFKEAEAESTLVMVLPLPAIKPFNERTGPEKVVNAI